MVPTAMVVVAFCFLLGLVYLARNRLLRLVGNLWIQVDRLEHADAILVLGDDNFSGDRASRAAELFHARWAPQIVASGRRLRPYASAADFVATDLQNRGVPPVSVLSFAHSADDTIDEAHALRGLIAQRGWKRILLITSNYHARRARYIFRKTLPQEISLTVIAAADSKFNPQSWWRSRQGAKLFFLEFEAYLVAMWVLRHHFRHPKRGIPPSVVEYTSEPSKTRRSDYD